MPDFEYTGYMRGEYTRQIRHHGLPPDLQKAIECDLATPLRQMANPVYAFDLRPYANPTTGRAAQRIKGVRDQYREKAQIRSERSLCGPASNLLDYLNARKPNIYARLINQNIKDAIKAAMKIGDCEKRIRILVKLRQIQEQPKPFYQPSRYGRTVRVFSLNESLLETLKSVRQALMKGCLECDLSNAHLAIVAYLWDIEQLYDNIGVDEDGRLRKIWPILFSAIGMDHDALLGAEEYDGIKSALKTVLYALVFGMSRQGLNWTLWRLLSGEAARQFMAHPLIAVLLKARERQFEKIDAEGGAVDCYGTRYDIKAITDKERKHEIRSTLASIAQAWEMRLLEGVIEDAVREGEKKQPVYQIVAWQHDGFTATVRTNKGAIERRLVGLVKEITDEYGIPTMLEAEWL